MDKEINIKNKNGFTLSEVLITLAIIGIIAALTVPSLITNINDQIYRTSFKKQYAEISQAINTIASENGGNMRGFNLDSNQFRDLLKQHMNYAKTCDANSSLGSCWHADGNEKFYNGSIVPTGEGDCFKLIKDESGMVLSNGALLTFTSTSSSCTCGARPLCAELHLDTNGFNGPNTIGKDIFRLQILSYGLVPFPIGNNITDPETIKFDCLDSGNSCPTYYLYN